MGTFTADGDGIEFIVSNRPRLHADGTFGGGTLSWKFKAEDGQWRPLANGSQTTNHDLSIGTTGVMRIRPTLTGSSGASIYYEAV